MEMYRLSVLGRRLAARASASSSTATATGSTDFLPEWYEQLKIGNKNWERVLATRKEALVDATSMRADKYWSGPLKGAPMRYTSPDLEMLAEPYLRAYQNDPEAQRHRFLVLRNRPVQRRGTFFTEDSLYLRLQAQRTMLAKSEKRANKLAAGLAESPLLQERWRPCLAGNSLRSWI